MLIVFFQHDSILSKEFHHQPSVSRPFLTVLMADPFSFLCSFVKGIFVSGDEKKKGVKRALESDETELEARKKRIEKAVNAVQEALTKLEEAAVKPQDLIKKEKSGKGEQDVAKGEGDVMGEIVVKESNSEDGEWHFDQMDDGEALSLDNDVSSDRIGECARDRGVMEHGHQSNRDSPLTSPIPRYSRLQAPGSREESEQLYDLMSMAPFEQKSKGSSPSPEIPEAVQSTQEVATFASRPTTPGQGNESPQDPHDQVVPETPPRRTHFTPQVPIKETPQPTLPTPTSVTSKDLNPPKAPPESISMASFASRSPRTSATPARQVKRLLEPLYTNEELYKPNFIFSTCPPRALPPKVQTHGTVWDVDILWANEETIYLTKSK